MQTLTLYYPNQAEDSHKPVCKSMFYCWKTKQYKNMSEHNKYMTVKCFKMSLFKVSQHFL